jgi:predicted porin
MNKKLLTLAVASAIVGGMGVAQADVTVYGKAHVSLDTMHVDRVGGYIKDGNLVVANNSSRLGFRFSEDLGGGFMKKVMGQYEASVTIDGEDAENPDAGNPEDVSTGIFGGTIRNSYLGLETAGGSLLAGTHDTPFKTIGRNVELFPEQLGDSRNLISAGASGVGWDLRPSNVVAYMSPTMAGLSVMALWVADGSTNANTDDNELNGSSISVSYKGGPLYVAAAYEIHDSNILASGIEDETGMRLVGSGTFGMFKVVALYQQVADVDGVSGADRSSWGLGGAVTLADKHVIKAQYYNADPVDNALTDNGATMYAVGYDYKLSKKATGYVSYAKTSNDENGRFGVNGGGHGDTLSTSGTAPQLLTGTDVSGISVGLILDF